MGGEGEWEEAGWSDWTQVPPGLFSCHMTCDQAHDQAYDVTHEP